MWNPFKSERNSHKSRDALPMTNAADLNHLEYARPLPNSTSYESSLDAALQPTDQDNKDMYAVSGRRAGLDHEPAPSLATSRRVSREADERLSGSVRDEIVDAALEEPKPEETNLFKMMIADFWTLLRIFKTMSWKEFFKTMTRRYLWSESRFSRLALLSCQG